MKRESLESYLGKFVEIKLFDDEIIKGEFHKTDEEQFKNRDFYLKKNYYFCIKPQSSLFRSSHVKKIKLLSCINIKQNFRLKESDK